MSSDYLVYWKAESVDRSLDELLEHHPSDQLARTRVAPGDTLWMVTVRDRLPYLFGKIAVGKVVSQREAERHFGTQDLWPARYHAIAEPKTEVSAREVPIADLTHLLRFDSNTADRLTVTAGGKVNPQELQSLRRLTPASARLLEQAWSQPSAGARDEQRDGARLGGAETGQGVRRASDEPVSGSSAQGRRRTPTGTQPGKGESREQAQVDSDAPFRRKGVEGCAIRCVRDWYVEQGWEVRSVEHERCGFDLVCTRPPREEYVEVKGVGGPRPIFQITAKELECAKTDPDFVLRVITLARSRKRGISRYSGKEFLEAFDLEPSQYRAAPRPVN